jgi:adenylate cyclase
LVDRVLVKGKTLPLELLEVRHPFSPDRFEEIAGRYNAAFADYERGEFVRAEGKFSALRDNEHDKPSALMAARCRELISDPPRDWNGIYELKTK